MTIDIPLENVKQPEFSFFNFLLSWIVDENAEKVEELGEEKIENITEEPGNINDEASPFSEIGDEEHLELFYIVSCIFLTYMIVIIMKRSWTYSRKKATFLANVKKLKLQEELNRLSTGNPAYMRLNSYY